MHFSDQFLDEVVARNDIADVVSGYVTLTRKGGNLFGLCPFHNEKTPSFSVAPDKQIYHCFGCKKGGGVINFIMEIEGLSFPEAVEFLAKRANIPLPAEDEARSNADRLRRRVLELNRTAARWYYEQLQLPQGAAVQAYLDKRQIRRGIAVRFGMGASLDQWDALLRAMTDKGFTKQELLASGLVVNGKNGGLYDKFRNRLMLPVIDVRGDVVGFGSRVIDKSEPKYMNTTETVAYSKRRVLYGLNLAKKTKRPNMILCEGNLDVVTLHQAGFDNAVACMGTALTQEQIRLLSRFTRELVLCYDNDGAGRMATDRALELLQNSEFTVKVLRLPQRLVDGHYVKQDADDFIKYQGKDAFEQLLSGSANGIEFTMSEIAAKYDLKDDKGRIAYAGKYSAPDYETILASGCGLAIENTMIYHTPEVKEQLEKFGIPVLVERSSYETDPLARMEWVKLYGILLGKQQEAEQLFDTQVQRVAPLENQQPTGKTVAFFSITSNNLVTVRKGSDYVARMIEMAGGSYVFADLTDSGNNLATINLSLEDFYAGAKDADVLLYNSTIEGSIASTEQLVEKCPLLAQFKAVQNGNVWCTAQSLFQQSMELPDLILDMNRVFTEGTPADSELTFLTHVE